MKRPKSAGFTLLETLAMLVCLFVIVWLCFALWRKANRPADENLAPATAIEQVESTSTPAATNVTEAESAPAAQ